LGSVVAFFHPFDSCQWLAECSVAKMTGKARCVFRAGKACATVPPAGPRGQTTKFEVVVRVDHGGQRDRIRAEDGVEQIGEAMTASVT